MESEVALHTPEVWSFWGNSPTDWARWHRYSGTAPLDLVLGDVNYDDCSFDIALHGTLQDRAARDAIRRIHLWSEDQEFLSSIISTLTATRGRVRSNSVDSFILSNDGIKLVDVSDFFAHYRFPKLRHLELDDCRIASWDLLMSRTAVLTTLILHLGYPSPTPTTSQLLSILASNPTLRKVSLSRCAVPVDGGGKSPFQVPLHHLKELKLTGGSRHVIGLLHRLDHPTYMDTLDIALCDCVVLDIPQIIGPYLRDYLRRRGRPQNGLGLSVFQAGQAGLHATLCVGDVCAFDPSTPMWGQVATFVKVTVTLDQTMATNRDRSVKGVLDLIPYTPRDEIVYFRSWGEPAAMEYISINLPNLRTLQFGGMRLSAALRGSNLDGNDNFWPFLQHIFIERLFVEDDGWDPLATFLAHRASSGNRLGSLVVVSSPHMCLEVEERIRGLVQEFRVDVDSLGRGTRP